MVSVIIPIHNIQRRGYHRVLYSLHSIIKQNNVKNIILCDSSNDKEFFILQDLLTNLPLDKVIHLRVKSDSFNKTLLLNKGIERADTEWIMCTDADYIFKRDFFNECRKFRSKKRILFKEVKMLPKINMNIQAVDNWMFPKADYNEWGHLANGACQYATREFFLANPYPMMEGFGAMDNIMAYIAFNKGLKIFWLQTSEILHQHHKVEKFMTKEDGRKFKNNQHILETYRKENNLPKLLKKTR